MNKKRTFGVILLVALLAALLAANVFLAPRGGMGDKSITIDVNHLNGETNTFHWQTDQEFLRDAMEEMGIIDGREDTYGLWVTSVDFETADEAKQQWWGYTVNGEDAVYGVDAQPIADGDTFVFTLNEGY